MDKMENQHGNSAEKTCGCPHHKMIPLIIVLIGIDILLGAFNVFTGWFVEVAAAILIIVAGATKLGGGKCKCC